MPTDIWRKNPINVLVVKLLEVGQPQAGTATARRKDLCARNATENSNGLTIVGSMKNAALICKYL